MATTAKKPAAKKPAAKKPAAKKTTAKKPAAKKTTTRKVAAKKAVTWSTEDIRTGAYYLAQNEGFAGDPIAYWLKAEKTLLAS